MKSSLDGDPFKLTSDVFNKLNNTGILKKVKRGKIRGRGYGTKPGTFIGGFSQSFPRKKSCRKTRNINYNNLIYLVGNTNKYNINNLHFLKKMKSLTNHCLIFLHLYSLTQKQGASIIIIW